MQRTITRRTERAHVLNTDEIRATLKHLGIWPDMRNNERLTITAMDFDSKACALTVRTTLVEVPISAEQPMPGATPAMPLAEFKRAIMADEARKLEALALLGVPTEPSKPAWQKFDRTLKPFAQQVGRLKRCTCTEEALASPDCPVHGDNKPMLPMSELRDELAKATPADLPAMGVPGLPPWPPKQLLQSRHELMNEMPKPHHVLVVDDVLPEPAVPIITGQQVEAMTDPRETQPEPAAEPEEALRAPVHLPKCDPGYRWLTDGELTDPKKGDEFNQGSGAGHGWHLTSRTGRLVHAGLVGAYRRPISAAAPPAPYVPSGCTCPERQPGPHHENPDCPVHGDNQPEPAPPASPFLGGSPFLVPHSKLCDSGARDHNCPGCQPTTCTCTSEIADPNCPEHRDL